MNRRTFLRMPLVAGATPMHHNRVGEVDAVDVATSAQALILRGIRVGVFSPHSSRSVATVLPASVPAHRVPSQP